MTNSSNITEKFFNNFPEIFHSPDKINAYLQENSNNIEKVIIDDFVGLGLENDFAIYANGGFGRQELYPSSDIDLSIVQKKKNINSYDNLEKFIAKLWNLGLKVGHSVRAIKDIKKITKEDPKEFTSYLTRRALLTNKQIDKDINLALSKIWTKKKFYKVKLSEQGKRYKSFFSTEYNLEPNLKESPGTLRDFQTSLWILQHCFDLKNIDEIKKSEEFGKEIGEVINSYNFVKAMRYITNIVSNKNRLTFEIQVEIADKAKLKEGTTKRSVEKLMQKFYENASKLSNFNYFVFEKFREQNQFAITKNYGDFFIKGSKIGFKKNTNLANQRELIFNIFIAIGESKKINAIETSSMSLLKNNLNLIDKNFRNDLGYATKFLKILKSQYNLSYIFKSMKSIGVIQKYIPELNEVIGQMQFDLFHAYTVDEHTFKVVRNMRQMHVHYAEEFKLEYELINKLPKIEILYLAGLFHDLGKGKGGDHSKIGAETSLDFAKKIGLSKADADLISWLVLNHLEMSSISQKKDISDPDTIRAFTEHVINIERLDYLYLLTINDIRATNPALWNGWKHGLLRDLFLLTRSQLNKEPVKTIKEISKDRKKNAIKYFVVLSDKNIVKDYFKLFDDSYFSKNNLDRLKWQSGLILSASNSSSVIGCRKCFGNLLEIFIKTDNTDGLFLKLVEVLEISGLEIIDANIFTSSNKAIAANTFITKFSYHDRVLSKNEIKDLQLKINNNFNNFSAQKKNFLKKKKSIETFNKKINITNIEDTVKKRNLLTIETSDSPGLLIKIAKVLHENGTSIYSARINTLGERVEDTFEIEDMTLSSVSKDKMKKISTSLKEII
jgi:[protein-PII] uridylyltransferase